MLIGLILGVLLMMMLSRFQLLLKACKDAYYEAGVTLHTHISHIKWATISMLMPAFLASPALAAAASGGTGCASTGTSNVLKIVNDLAWFLVGIGGAVGVFMFALGGCFIIFGFKTQHVAKGHDMLKQAIIGFAILAGGLFIKTVILGLIFPLGASESGQPTTCS